MFQPKLQQRARIVALQYSQSLRNRSATKIINHVRSSSTNPIDQEHAILVSQQDGTQILVNQRLRRPVAPHLSIYRPQITWYGSAFNRITGVALSGPLYIFGAAYLAAPVFGWQITSAAMAAGFAKWPALAQLGLKIAAAIPFTFHSFNGLRHLVWDTGRALTNPQVIRTGWTVVGISILTSVGLAFFL